jgi:hypothetical protein
MNEKDYIKHYLQPSPNRLDNTFTHPLPDIEGLKKCGDFIVQGELEDTFSTNIISKYVSDTEGIKLVEVYKNTQNKVTGVFIRLVGTVSFVKKGYPFLFLDAAVSNVSMLTAEREDITTRVAIHLPQSDPEQNKIFFNLLNEKTKENGISHRTGETDKLPDFWGPIWSTESKRFDLDMIRQLRGYASNAYKNLIEQTREKSSFDYKPMQEHLVFNISMSEHLLFKKLGLTVPAESQAAFFSALSYSI